MKFLYLLNIIFGRNIFRIFLYPTIFWYFVGHKVAREASREYLSKLFKFSKGSTPLPSLSNVFKHFFEFAECILDKMLIWGGRWGELTYKYEGLSIFEELHKSGKGAIIVVSHLGNLDLCRAISTMISGVKVTALVHTAHSLKFNKMLAEINQESALNMVEVTEFNMEIAINLSERVGRGEFIAIAGDRVPVSDKSVVKVDFLGSVAALPSGPYILGHVLKCPLISLISIKKKGVYTLSFETLEDGRSSRRAELQIYLSKTAQKFACILEKSCIASPLQWFNFFPFWESTSGSKSE